MLVEARDVASGAVQYFDLNFPARNGSEFTFMWMDGTRRRMALTQLSERPADAAIHRAALDVASHEIVVQSGR